MAVGHRLPNGYIVLLLTPREATLHRDQILAPEDYPWTNPTESQMVAMEVRGILTDLVTQDSLQRLQETSQELIRVMRDEEQEQKMKKERERLEKEGQWRCPNCSYVALLEEDPCPDCDQERPKLP
jgi:rubrerythrin